MNRHAISILRGLEPYEHLCATVSPYNFWNIRILLDTGFAVRKLKKKYGGKLRYIVHMNLKNPDRFSSDPELQVSLTDFNRQKELFDKGWCAVQLSGKPVNEYDACLNIAFEDTLKNLKIGFVRLPCT
jgi:hypothetical protein